VLTRPKAQLHAFAPVEGGAECIHYVAADLSTMFWVWSSGALCPALAHLVKLMGIACLHFLLANTRPVNSCRCRSAVRCSWSDRSLRNVFRKPVLVAVLLALSWKNIHRWPCG